MPGKASGKADRSERARRHREPPAQRVRVSEEPAGRLSLGKGLERGGRVGDPRAVKQRRLEFPDARVREAGQSGGEIPYGDLTADDAAPETFLDDTRSSTPSDVEPRQPADTVLRGRTPGATTTRQGKDEAELADSEPVGWTESRRLRSKARAHARDPNAVEPHEAEEQAQQERARQGGGARSRT
ncbi:MAG: hypothetical protein AB1651_05635 [Pseudomonadota bacterium]